MFTTINHNIEEKITLSGIIPLIDNDNLETSKALCEATINSGCNIIEFGIRHEESLKHCEILFNFVKKKSPEILFGAGSISDVSNAKKVINIGVDFVIGPGLDRGVAKECQESNTFYIPGCATVNEILKAREMGFELIKIFPVKLLGGTKFLKAIKAPLPWLKAIPAGGIKANLTDVIEWINLGARAVTLGSDLYKKDSGKINSVLEIETTLKTLLREIAKIKKTTL